LDDIYSAGEITTQSVLDDEEWGKISEKEKFHAAKQILLGLAILYALSILAYLIRPEDGIELLDICKTALPPLATLILVFYFRESPEKRD
jgi:hypothetical protein